MKENFGVNNCNTTNISSIILMCHCKANIYYSNIIAFVYKIKNSDYFRYFMYFIGSIILIFFMWYIQGPTILAQTKTDYLTEMFFNKPTDIVGIVYMADYLASHISDINHHELRNLPAIDRNSIINAYNNNPAGLHKYISECKFLVNAVLKDNSETLDTICQNIIDRVLSQKNIDLTTLHSKEGWVDTFANYWQGKRFLVDGEKYIFIKDPNTNKWSFVNNSDYRTWLIGLSNLESAYEEVNSNYHSNLEKRFFLEECLINAKKAFLSKTEASSILTNHGQFFKSAFMKEAELQAWKQVTDDLNKLSPDLFR